MKALSQQLSRSKSPDLELEMGFVNTHVLQSTPSLNREKDAGHKGEVERGREKMSDWMTEEIQTETKLEPTQVKRDVKEPTWAWTFKQGFENPYNIVSW